MRVKFWDSSLKYCRNDTPSPKHKDDIFLLISQYLIYDCLDLSMGKILNELTLNEPATTGRIVDRVEVKLDLTSDQ